MSAERLQKAAALMRSRAASCKQIFGGEFTVTEAATGDLAPWPFTLRNGTQVLAERLDRADAEHIASWSPAVALAVADWLDLMAADYAPYWAEPYAAPFVPVIEKAYWIADAYLGGAS